MENYRILEGVYVYFVTFTMVVVNFCFWLITFSPKTGAFPGSYSFLHLCYVGVS
jgi:hypothetical protein